MLPIREYKSLLQLSSLARLEGHWSRFALRCRILHDERFHRFYYSQHMKLFLMGREDSTLVQTSQVKTYWYAVVSLLKESSWVDCGNG